MEIDENQRGPFAQALGFGAACEKGAIGGGHAGPPLEVKHGDRDAVAGGGDDGADAGSVGRVVEGA